MLPTILYRQRDMDGQREELILLLPYLCKCADPFTRLPSPDRRRFSSRDYAQAFTGWNVGFDPVMEVQFSALRLSLMAPHLIRVRASWSLNVSFGLTSHLTGNTYGVRMGCPRNGMGCDEPHAYRFGSSSLRSGREDWCPAA